MLLAIRGGCGVGSANGWRVMRHGSTIVPHDTASLQVPMLHP